MHRFVIMYFARRQFELERRARYDGGSSTVVANVKKRDALARESSRAKAAGAPNNTGFLIWHTWLD